MLISVRATAAYDLPEQTFLLLMVEPPLVGPAHRVQEERLQTTPTPFHELGTDVYGNPQRRIIAPEGIVFVRVHSNDRDRSQRCDPR